MTRPHDRRAHADALRRQNRINQGQRFQRQAGAMLAAVALGAVAVPYMAMDSQALSAAGTYYKAEAVAWFAQGTVANPTVKVTIAGADYVVAADAVIAHGYYRENAIAARSNPKTRVCAALRSRSANALPSPWFSRLARMRRSTALTNPPVPQQGSST